MDNYKKLMLTAGDVMSSKYNFPFPSLFPFSSLSPLVFKSQFDDFSDFIAIASGFKVCGNIFKKN